MVDAVKQNFPQREIADASFELQTEIDAGRRSSSASTPTATRTRRRCRTLRIDPALERKQIERVRGGPGAARRREGGGELVRLREAAARDGENLMPSLLDAARAHATEGEIVMALQDVWGDYRETPVF